MNVRDATRYLHGLCIRHNVPKIRIDYLTDEEYQHSMKARFDGETYTISICGATTLKELKHEFIHYAIRLSEVSAELEENICDGSI